jgi:uncharacterized protein YkwD
LSAINDYRAGRHLLPLVADPLLERVARQRVGVFDHHAFGRWSWEQAHAEGFRGPVTDNLAQGYADDPADAVNGWARSDGHARQMRGFTSLNNQWIDRKFTLCGVAHQGQNVIAVFGRSDSDDK